MKKIINLLLIIILALTWRFHFIKKEDSLNEYQNHIKKADKFYSMKANLDSFKEYENSEKYAQDKDKEYILLQKIKILLDEDEYLKARHLIDKAYKNKVNLESASKIYLDFCKKNEKYKDMNQFLDDYRKNLDLTNFEKDILSEFIIFPGDYEEINQIGSKMFLLKDKSKQYIVDDNGRKLFTSYYDKVIGFDEKNKLITIKDKNENYLIDFKKNIRAKLSPGDIKTFIDASYVHKKNKLHLKNQLNETINKADYIGNLSDDKRVIINLDKLNIVDKNSKKLHSLKATNTKLDINNNDIVNDMLIIKKDKFRLYDLKEKSYSKFYDEIDFNKEDYIAVKKKDKWGFIDHDFVEVSKFVYDEAKSFSNSIALVKKDGKKFFIDKNFKNINNFNYEDFINFNEEGIGFVKVNGKWNMIKLLRKVR